MNLETIVDIIPPVLIGAYFGFRDDQKFGLYRDIPKLQKSVKLQEESLKVEEFNSSYLTKNKLFVDFGVPLIVGITNASFSSANHLPFLEESIASVLSGFGGVKLGEYLSKLSRSLSRPSKKQTEILTEFESLLTSHVRKNGLGEFPSNISEKRKEYLNTLVKVNNYSFLKKKIFGLINIMNSAKNYHEISNWFNDKISALPILTLNTLNNNTAYSFIIDNYKREIHTGQMKYFLINQNQDSNVKLKLYSIWFKKPIKLKNDTKQIHDLVSNVPKGSRVYLLRLDSSNSQVKYNFESLIEVFKSDCYFKHPNVVSFERFKQEE